MQADADVQANTEPSTPNGPPSLPTLLQYLRSEIRTALFGEGTVDANDHRVLELELEQLPYNLMSARRSLIRLEELIQKIVEEPPESIPNVPDGLHQFAIILQQDFLSIAWTVDQFLDSSRRAQNALTRFVARAYRVSIPLSMNEYVGRAERYRSKVPGAVSALLRNYWAHDGLILKQYRDLAQHHMVVSSNMAVLRRPTEPRFQLLLPSNPEEASLRDLKYDAPRVHALVYCRSAFLALVDVSYKLTYLIFRHLGISKDASWSLIRPLPVSLGPPESFAALPSDDLDTALAEVSIAAFNESLAAYGALGDPRLAQVDQR